MCSIFKKVFVHPRRGDQSVSVRKRRFYKHDSRFLLLGKEHVKSNVIYAYEITTANLYVLIAGPHDGRTRSTTRPPTV